MMKLLRSQSQTVLIVVLGVIAFGFLFYGNAGNLLTSGTAHTSNDFGRIDGEDLSVGDLYDSVRNTRYLLTIFGQSAELQQPGAAKQIAATAWQQLLLLHEADRLHINVDSAEIADWIRKQPVFQKDGAFSMDAYNDAMKMLQIRLRISPDAGTDPVAATKATFENVIRDYLRTQAVSHALFDVVRSPASGVEDTYQKYYGKETVSYVTLDPKTYEKSLQVTPADIEAEYKNNPNNPDYRTSEQRKVDYVLFMLTPEQQKLPDDQKKAAKNALGQQALDFALALQPTPSADPNAAAPAPDFQAEAKKRNLTPVTTDLFTADQPPANVPPSSAFNQAAFALSKDSPVSKVVEMENGVAILHLNQIQPSELKPLDAVKADIQKALLEKDARNSAQIEGQLRAKMLQASVAKGTDFKTAAASTKLTVVTVPGLVPSSTSESDPKMQGLAYATVSLKPGEVSQAFNLPGTDLIAIAHLDSRETADPAGLADFEKRYRSQQDDQLRTIAANDWVNWKSKQPGTHRPPDLDAYGTVE